MATNPPGDLEVLIDRVLNQVTREDAIAAIERRSDERERASAIVNALPPGVPQRTPEWYRVRRGMITASEFKIAGADTACDSYVWGKIFPQPFPSNDAMRWGCRFEDLAAATYEFEHGTKIHEYGLLIHPDDAWLGASPDGITAYGVAIEIKCPYSRKRVEIERRVDEDRPFPKSDRANLYARYAPQVQGQLEVCGLEACDFVVAHIDEVEEGLFWQLRRVSEHAHRYAIVADMVDPTTGALAYVTSPLGIDDAALLAWQKAKVEAGCIGVHHVHVRELGVNRIRRDRSEWARLRANLGRTKDTIDGIRGSAAKDSEALPPGCVLPMFTGDLDDTLVDAAATTAGVATRATGTTRLVKHATAPASVPVVGSVPLFLDDD